MFVLVTEKKCLYYYIILINKIYCFMTNFYIAFAMVFSSKLMFKKNIKSRPQNEKIFKMLHG